MAQTVTVRASVKLELVVDVSDAWGGDCMLEQVYEQAKRAAIEKVAGAIKSSNEAGRPMRATVNGAIAVTAILVTRSDA
jgi:hypothetical protein